jgi:hypothetical protein
MFDLHAVSIFDTGTGETDHLELVVRMDNLTFQAKVLIRLYVICKEINCKLSK